MDRTLRAGGGTNVFDNHDEERELDAERLVLVGRARDVVRRNIGAHDLEHAGLDVLVRDALNVPIAHLLVPDLKRLAADAVQNGQEPRLEGVLEHAAVRASSGLPPTQEVR